MKRKAKPTIVSHRMYNYVEFGKTTTHTIEQAFEDKVFKGILLTPHAGGKVEFIEGAAAQKILSRFQDALYAK